MTYDPGPMHPLWVDWAFDNLLRGAPESSISDGLVSAGMSSSAAQALLDDAKQSSWYQAAARLHARQQARDEPSQLLQGYHRSMSLEASRLDEDTFHEFIWTAHRPVVQRGIASHWPELSLELLNERHGDIEVEVLRGRDQHDRWWIHRDALTTQLPLSELLHHMSTEFGDDVYGVGRNNILERLPVMMEGVTPLPGIAEDFHHQHLWIGPGGTLTPLHHDQSSAWLVQRLGCKRVWITSPMELDLLDTAEGLFNRLDPREDTVERWHEVVLEAGDAMFLPAGWWHQVVSESASISQSFGGFKWPHSHTWYNPGRPTA